MNKCKILWADNKSVLEHKINEFIEDKKVISISLTLDILTNYCACIIYEEWGE